MTDRLKIGQEVLIHGYVDEIRKDTIIVRNEGGYFGTVECEVTDIEMNDVLDKIRDEIESEREEISKKQSEHPEDEGLRNYYFGLNDGLKDARDIIDKYKEEWNDKK